MVNSAMRMIHRRVQSKGKVSDSFALKAFYAGMLFVGLSTVAVKVFCLIHDAYEMETPTVHIIVESQTSLASGG